MIGDIISTNSTAASAPPPTAAPQATTSTTVAAAADHHHHPPPQRQPPPTPPHDSRHFLVVPESHDNVQFFQPVSGYPPRDSASTNAAVPTTNVLTELRIGFTPNRYNTPGFHDTASYPRAAAVMKSSASR
jgi:hypothetical protein